MRLAGECRAAGKAVTVGHGRAGKQGIALQEFKPFQVGQGKKAWHAGQGRHAIAGQAEQAGRAVQAGEGRQGRQADQASSPCRQGKTCMKARQRRRSKPVRQGREGQTFQARAVWPGRQGRVGRAG